MPQLSFDKHSTAVIIADFYKEQMTNLPHARDRKVLEKALSIQAAARSQGMFILYTATVFREGYPEISPHNKAGAARKASGQPAVSDPLKILHPDLAPQPGEPIIEKHRTSGFSGTDLEIILRANGINTLVLMGFSTSGVTLSMVKHAADADYEIVVVEDCCAEFEPDIHDFLMERIFPRLATIASSAEVLKAIEG